MYATPIATRCDKRASVMTWRFNGGDCEQSFNIQEADKFTCTDFSGGAPTEGSAWLTVTSVKDETDVYFDGEVRVGDLFTMFAGNTNKGKFDADSFFYVYSDSSKTNLLQLSSVHTSCSQNLFLKDKFGSVQLLIFENEFGLFTCFVQATYGFTLTNQGAANSGTIVEHERALYLLGLAALSVEPVRIDEVARHLAAQSPRPIDIVYTGLRPGEKMHEVLLGLDELDHRPAHPLISHVAVPPLDPASLAEASTSGATVSIP